MCLLDIHISSVLFFSRPQSEGWPHHGRTFSIYLCPLSFWLTVHGESCSCLDLVPPSRVWSSLPACTWHCSLHYLFLQATPGHTLDTQRIVTLDYCALYNYCYLLTYLLSSAVISRIFVEIGMLWRVALFHETERNRAISIVKCVTKMYQIAILVFLYSIRTRSHLSTVIAWAASSPRGYD